MSALLTEFLCSVCHEPFQAYRPSRETTELPVCPGCELTTANGIRKLFGYEPTPADQERPVEPQEVN